MRKKGQNDHCEAKIDNNTNVSLLFDSCNSQIGVIYTYLEIILTNKEQVINKMMKNARIVELLTTSHPSLFS